MREAQADKGTAPGQADTLLACSLKVCDQISLSEVMSW